ncbi:glycosyltransferase family 2 protein [Streptomyces sp. NRRL WC-3618]|uniref:glycosyltransferase family 2 protein n=1 Tax=Streptomyces sp. NRRL WC-3618 TaxID=1519490 RepID=UPI00099D1520|nr:glycosyltransferase [Streptomyces sp. NRRL WC-3618]
MLPTLSVVVPVFNVEHYISPCLESLLNQDLSNVEIIVVDDGSTDLSGTIAEGWRRKDDRINIISQSNAGLSAARNAGFRAARGKYLAFCDSDDVVTPTGYRHLVETLEATGSDMASGDVRRMDSSGVRPHSGYEDVFAQGRRRTHIRHDVSLVRDRMAWNKVFRRSFWDAKNLAFSLPAYEDAPVMIRAHIEASAVDVLPEIIYYWRIREVGPPSITQRMREPDNVAACMRSVVETFGVITALAPELVAPYATDMCRRDVRNALRSLHLHDDATLGDAVRLAQSFVRSVPTDVLQALPQQDRHLMELLVRNELQQVRDHVDPPPGS